VLRKLTLGLLSRPRSFSKSSRRRSQPCSHPPNDLEQAWQWYRLRKALGTWGVLRALLLLKNLHSDPTTSDVYTPVLENPSRCDIRGERSFVLGCNGLVLEVDGVFALYILCRVEVKDLL